MIDPLIDGVTGEQTIATSTISERVTQLAHNKYPHYEVMPFSSKSVSNLPYIMVGTFTPVNAQNQPTGDREAFRFCLIMADLRSGKVVARAWVRARIDGVDSTPVSFFRDSPTWSDDAQTTAYIRTCQDTRIGDPISPIYVEGIVTASIISDAIALYDEGHYRDALDLYSTARATKAGHQLRVYNGLYLANWRLGFEEQAATAFGEAVAFGLANRRLSVKFLFRPGSADLVSYTQDQPYRMWIKQIANLTARLRTCLQICGNTSKSGTVALNERLSELRANYIKEQLRLEAPELSDRLTAIGLGSSANLVGTGADDASDALDRRVDFKMTQPCLTG